MNDIEKWPVGIKAKFTHIVELIEKYGVLEVGMPHIKALGGSLFEMRAKGKEGIGRAFFCMVTGETVIILHSFIKKTQATPKKELDIAKKHLQEVRNNG